jgi:hypothetical protein
LGEKAGNVACPSGHSKKFCGGWNKTACDSEGCGGDHTCDNPNQPKGATGCPNDKNSANLAKVPDCTTTPSDPSCIQNTVSPLPGLIPGGNIADTNTGDTTTPPTTNTGDTNPAPIENNGAPIDNGGGTTDSKLLSPDNTVNNPTDNGGDTTTIQPSPPPDNGGTTTDNSVSSTDNSGSSNDNGGASSDSGGGGDSGGRFK